MKSYCFIKIKMLEWGSDYASIMIFNKVLFYFI